MQSVDRYGMRIATLSGTRAGHLSVELVQPAEVRERPGQRAYDAGVNGVDKSEHERDRFVRDLRRRKPVAAAEGGVVARRIGATADRTGHRSRVVARQHVWRER